MQTWIPAKAPATNVVRLESRILITFYHGRIGVWIPLEVPEKPQSPHTHTQTDMASLKYTSWPAAQAPHLQAFWGRREKDYLLAIVAQKRNNLMITNRKFQKVLWQCAKFLVNDPKNVPENWQCAKFFRVFLRGHFFHWHCMVRFVHKARSASRCSLCSRPITANNPDVTMCPHKVSWIPARMCSFASIRSIQSQLMSTCAFL